MRRLILPGLLSRGASRSLAGSARARRAAVSHARIREVVSVCQAAKLGGGEARGRQLRAPFECESVEDGREAVDAFELVLGETCRETIGRRVAESERKEREISRRNTKQIKGIAARENRPTMRTRRRHQSGNGLDHAPQFETLHRCACKQKTKSRFVSWRATITVCSTLSLALERRSTQMARVRVSRLHLRNLVHLPLPQRRQVRHLHPPPHHQHLCRHLRRDHHRRHRRQRRHRPPARRCNRPPLVNNKVRTQKASRCCGNWRSKQSKQVSTFGFSGQFRSVLKNLLALRLARI